MSRLGLELGDRVRVSSAGGLFGRKLGSVVGISRRGLRVWVRVKLDEVEGGQAFEPWELEFVERPGLTP